MNNIKKAIISLGILPVFALGLVAVSPLAVSAVNPADETCSSTNINVGSGAKCAKSADQKTDINVVIKDVTNVLLFIIGAVAVIMIIIGGIRYTTSNGDSSQVTAAKNTILYGVIGVIIALLAFAIVNFVIGAFTTTPSGGGGGAAATE